MRHTLLTWLCLSLTASGCGGAQGGADASRGEPVTLSVDPQSRWRELRIEGATDLPDGAVVSYRVPHSVANELPPSEWPATNLIDDGTAVVQDGVYWAELNTTYWPSGQVDVRVQFPVAPQPDDVRARYGDFGERLTGENIQSLGSSNVVVTEQILEWTR